MISLAPLLGGEIPSYNCDIPEPAQPVSPIPRQRSRNLKTTKPRGDARPALTHGAAVSPPPEATAPLLISLLMLVPLAVSA